ncbi:hypothetical protein C4571_02020 [Candidatus Parcubacteria bacterium]|nr:MAG: hypothetical protein C4571_02020 [Candidatus Parcubacteria bacterium]
MQPQTMLGLYSPSNPFASRYAFTISRTFMVFLLPPFGQPLDLAGHRAVEIVGGLALRAAIAKKGDFNSAGISISPSRSMGIAPSIRSAIVPKPHPLAECLDLFRC